MMIGAKETPRFGFVFYCHEEKHFPTRRGKIAFICYFIAGGVGESRLLSIVRREESLFSILHAPNNTGNMPHHHNGRQSMLKRV
jgi:hypothetical protein